MVFSFSISITFRSSAIWGLDTTAFLCIFNNLGPGSQHVNYLETIGLKGSGFFANIDNKKITLNFLQVIYPITLLVHINVDGDSSNTSILNPWNFFCLFYFGWDRFRFVFCWNKKKTSSISSIDAVSNGWESSWGFQPLLQISALFLWLRAPPSSSPPDRHQHWSANHFSCNHPHNKLFKKPWNLTLLQISTAAVIALKRSPLPPSP